MDYWIETYVASNYALFWVEIANNLSFGNTQNAIIWYGNSVATTTSNGASTFIDFDDFLTDTLANYVQIDSGWSINTNASGYLVSPSSSGQQGFISKDEGLARVYALRAKVYMSSADAGIGFIWGTAGGGESSVNGYIQNYSPSTISSQLMKYDSGSPTNLANLPALSAGWYLMELRLTFWTVIAVRDTTVDATADHSSITMIWGVGFRQKAASTNIIDWWAVRKYVSPEPYISTWSGEIENSQLQLRSQYGIYPRNIRVTK